MQTGNVAIDLPPAKAKSLARRLLESVTLYKQLMADGTPREKAGEIVGEALKAEWGSGRESRYRCFTCRDTGWIEIQVRKTFGEGMETRVRRCDGLCPYILHQREMRAQRQGGAKSMRAAGQVQGRP